MFLLLFSGSKHYGKDNTMYFSSDYSEYKIFWGLS